MHGLPHNFQPDYRQNFLTSLELPSIGSRTSSPNKLSSSKGKSRQNNPTFSGPQYLSHFFKTDHRAEAYFHNCDINCKRKAAQCKRQKKKFTKNLASGMFSIKEQKLFLVQT
jgi:hypothetical protein